MDEPEHITELLRVWGTGDEQVLEKLMPLVYDELHRQASRFLQRERPGHTLQATALIHEAYIKLLGQDQVEWQSRSHFFAIASQAMRRILVDHARSRHRLKRGGPGEHIALDEALHVGASSPSVDLVALDEALQRLERLDKRQARVVELRYFSGLTNEDTAQVLGVSNATVRNDWSMAKAWLRQQLKTS